ncbi:hypothetical protein vBAbaMPhT2_218 [Acinetobacter phage vB_AbaM_PhT2]|uniref:Uncharacterized protein n=1 Tax=Acinetobacter phage vB_AbaM_PhT2 TaxID=2690230 RepID=A0A6B9SWA2_9CAUD|nr:hypothetical protein HYQ24_gp220 [Acinetobacter phage vB_AbaM_PhT2]QHJ75821.1 hypothetical protein vBAbaMPhT2_218 [Acinetobacter phage vB_AbaM_PhT2]
MAGYHVADIKKSMHSSAYKLIEEAQEFIDALASDNRIMAQVELSDLYGALKHQANQLGVSLKDLDIMSETTKGAFEANGRPSFGSTAGWKKYLLENATSFVDGIGQVKIWVDYNTYYIIFTENSTSLPMVSESDIKGFTTVGEVIRGEIYVPQTKMHKKPGQLFHRNDSYHWVATKGTLVKFTRTERPTKLSNTDKIAEALECLNLI